MESKFRGKVEGVAFELSLTGQMEFGYLEKQDWEGGVSKSGRGSRK